MKQQNHFTKETLADFLRPYVAAEVNNKRRCQYIYYNLTKSLNSRENTELPNMYISELMETARCDNFSDMSELRLAFANRLTIPLLTKIMNSEEELNGIEYQNSAKVLLYYADWTNDILFSALSFSNKFHYFTTLKAERTFAFLGVVGSTVGAYKIVSNALKSQKQFSLNTILPIK